MEFLHLVKAYPGGVFHGVSCKVYKEHTAVHLNPGLQKQVGTQYHTGLKTE